MGLALGFKSHLNHKANVFHLKNHRSRILNLHARCRIGAAERPISLRNACIDRNNAIFKASATRQTRAISLAKIPASPKTCVIGHGDNFIFGFKFKQWRDRAKSFFGEGHHMVVMPVSTVGWKKVSPIHGDRHLFNLSAFRHRVTDMAFDFFKPCISISGLGDAIIGAIADFHLFDLSGQGGGKFIINPACTQMRLAQTHAARYGILTLRFAHGNIKINVIKDDQRRVAAHSN